MIIANRKLVLGEKGTEDSSEKESAWIEAASILGAVVLVVLVTSFNDYAKEGQFRKLQAKISDEQRVLVVRRGQNCEISHVDLVVGDIYVIKSGVSTSGYSRVDKC